MDKNFINIDDLVRQHLEGAEEKERAGAWLKMRDLLDEEMPRKKRVGIIYWKRIFGLVAAASLIGTMAVGSYELSSVYRRSVSNGPVSGLSDKDFSRESGLGTMDVQPAWIGDEPATSGKINIRGNVQNTATSNEATTPKAEKPYNGGGNSSYMAAISTAASADASKRKTDGATISNVAADATDGLISSNNVAANNGSESVQLSTGSLRPLSSTDVETNAAQARNISEVTTNVTPGNTIASKSATSYNNTQEQGSIHAKRNRRSAQTHNGDWNATATAAGTGSRIVPNNPVHTDAARANTTKTNKTVKSNSNASGIAAKNNTNARAGQIATTTNQNTNNNNTNNNDTRLATTGAATNYGNENLSGSIKARRNRRSGTSMARLDNTAAGTMPTSGTRIADAGVRSTPITGSNTQPGNSHSGSGDKPTVLNAAASGAAGSNSLSRTAHTPAGSATSATASKSRSNKGENSHSNHTAGKATNYSDNVALTADQNTASHTTASGTGESGLIKGHRNKPAAGHANGSNSGNGAAGKAIGANKITHPSTAVLASAATLGKHNSVGKQEDVSNNELADDQETDETAQKQEGDKKVITKIVLRQREIKNGNETHTQVDTVSMEKFSKQSDVATEDNDPLSGNVTAKRGTSTPAPAAAEPDADTKPATADKSTSGKKHRRRHNAAEDLAAAPAATTDAEEAPRTAMADAPADNAAAASANPSEVAAKKKNTERKSGASLLQKLSSAFNDVKQNATGAKFTPGITAGINSNFFGPSKMMGFQFGATGSFDFNETWSLMAELKYFNRLNNNNIEDNYYSYTDMGNGQYRRELVRNTYDFAAMHTMEMPLTIRYAKGNFNFYAGGNLQYAFSINTAPATTPDPTVQATFVNAPGTDNKPSYSEADFRSRFALGYIFGFSYQVAPNTSLDIRNVQSVWDNAATTGARSVSSMLYRTPSVQLSVMYRLGGNKNKE